MKKSVPFELFAPNQFIYFDILRLKEFEDRMGIPFGKMVSQEAGINFCLIGLSVGLKHHYKPANPTQFFAEKIDEYLDSGGALLDISMKIIEAILMSNALGKHAPADNDSKNVPTVQLKAENADVLTASQNG